jgi:hypothetical protein
VGAALIMDMDRLMDRNEEGNRQFSQLHKCAEKDIDLQNHGMDR